MNKRLLHISILVLVLVVITIDANAQCAMCKAVAESATDEAGDTGAASARK